MDKRYNTPVLLEARKRFQRIMEYVEASGAYDINEDDDEMAQAPDAGASPMGGDTKMGETDPTGEDMPMGGAPMGMNGDNAGADPMTDDAGMGSGGAEGFNPQGPDATMGAGETENLGGDPNSTEDEEEEVIDVDDLTDSQENTEHKVSKILDRLDKMDDKIFGALDRAMEIVTSSNERMDKLEAEFEKRNPTPDQKMNLRAQKSAPFDEKVEDYWQTKAPKNYSIEDDNNGEDMPEYQIMKSDVDNFSNYSEAYKSFDDEDEKYGHMSLRDIYDL